MKIEIDTTQKKITVLEDCTIKELSKFLKEKEMQDYKIEVKQPYYYYPWGITYTEPLTITPNEGITGAFYYDNTTTNTTLIN